MFREQSQVGLKGWQHFHRVERRGSGSAQASNPFFLFRDDLLCVPYATLRQGERIVIRTMLAEHARGTLLGRLTLEVRAAAQGSES